MTLSDSFEGDGIVFTDFANNKSDGGRSMTLQADGKILVSGFSDGDFAIARYNADGTLDETFDFDGLVTTDIGGRIDSGLSIILQTDGKILVAGQGDDGSGNFDIILVRYNPDGTLDTSFDADGIVTTDFGNDIDFARSVAVQADGKILVTGVGRDGGNDFALVRYNEDGSLDTTFDSDGVVTIGFGSARDQGTAVAVQSDGKILVAGQSNEGGNGPNFALARYNTDGSPDTSFDFDGSTTTDLAGRRDGGNSLAIQADGKILVAGFVENSSGNFDFGLVRYNSDGSLDTSFDADGIVTTDTSFNLQDSANSVTIQSDGKILVAGSGGRDLALVRYNTDGSLDTTFDSDGIVITDVGGTLDEGFSVTVQPDGKILVAGGSNANGRSDFVLVRYNADGSLDTLLNEAPIITSDGGGETASVSIDENSFAVTTVEATDADGDNLSYSLAGGDDQGLFEIDANSGLLSFIDAPDFENPTDQGADNIYDVIVQVDDGNGGSDSQAIAVSVGNLAGETWSGGNQGQSHVGTGEEDTLSGGNGKDIIDGGAGNDSISGGNGKDVIIGGAGDDILTGGNGMDTFVFGENFGKDVITDFGNDLIEFEQSIFSNSADVLNNAAQIGADTVITYDAENNLTLQNVALSSLDEGDFLIV